MNSIWNHATLVQAAEGMTLNLTEHYLAPRRKTKWLREVLRLVGGDRSGADRTEKTEAAQRSFYLAHDANECSLALVSSKRKGKNP